MSRAGEPAPDTRLAPGKRRQERERLEISQYGGSGVRAETSGPPSATPYSPPGSTPSSMSANSSSLAER
ncbi:hypothetical protein BC793_104432 [Actinoplanes xinjiangensis]|jgi:hypothetical protein|uniref:Uncharacterized protein n=1 Tax=Actinoplanes xinjiangensis TaxID=512350 RepID=A0A316FPY1_9ACTN|nr:hypothetical protein BC793_104432 [Actinoplanes xinjiangensis]GIF37762.1 hypothetical protein Axi01nite_20730 [Actinoplanes xinjiangensis]